MSRMAKFGALVVVGLLVGADAPGKDEDAKKELKKLQGTWQLVSETEDGKDKTAEDCKKIKFTLDADGNWEVKEDGKLLFKGTSKLVPGQKPRAIDYTLTEGDFKDTVIKGIYEVDGDSFKHCWSVQGDRPTKFESRSGSGQTNSVFKRQK